MATAHTTTSRLMRGTALARRTVFAAAAGALALTVAACGTTDASPSEVADLHLDKNKPTVTSAPR